MVEYSVSAHLRLVDRLNNDELSDRFDDLRARLGNDSRPRVFGRYAGYVVVVVVDAESETAAQDHWFREVDPALDASKLGKGEGHARYTTPVTVEELRLTGG